jgi:hypothetical protein
MIPAEALEELKQKHGTVVVLEAGDYTVVVRKPTRAHWRRFREYASDPAKRPICAETLFRDCVVYPDAKALEAMLEDKPALAELFGGEVADIAGAGLEVRKNG